jgi:hypothetical protein
MNIVNCKYKNINQTYLLAGWNIVFLIGVFTYFMPNQKINLLHSASFELLQSENVAECGLQWTRWLLSNGHYVIVLGIVTNILFYIPGLSSVFRSIQLAWLIVTALIILSYAYVAFHFAGKLLTIKI